MGIHHDNKMPIEAIGPVETTRGSQMAQVQRVECVDSDTEAVVALPGYKCSLSQIHAHKAVVALPGYECSLPQINAHKKIRRLSRQKSQQSRFY
jgi:hypothetical protein